MIIVKTRLKGKELNFARNQRFGSTAVKKDMSVVHESEEIFNLPNFIVKMEQMNNDPTNLVCIHNISMMGGKFTMDSISREIVEATFNSIQSPQVGDREQIECICYYNLGRIIKGLCGFKNVSIYRVSRLKSAMHIWVGSNVVRDICIDFNYTTDRTKISSIKFDIRSPMTGVDRVDDIIAFSYKLLSALLGLSSSSYEAFYDNATTELNT